MRGPGESWHCPTETVDSSCSRRSETEQCRGSARSGRAGCCSSSPATSAPHWLLQACATCAQDLPALAQAVPKQLESSAGFSCLQASAALTLPAASRLQELCLSPPTTARCFLSFPGRFNQADSKNSQAITRKRPRSVLGHVFHCCRLSCSVNSVQLLPPVGVTDGQMWCPLAPRLHQRLILRGSH